MRNTVRTATAALAALLFAGCAPSAPELPADTSPAAVASKLTDSGGAAFLREISMYSWPDDGRRAAELFSWIATDADSPDPESASRAGRSAHAIASALADDFVDLKNLAGGNPDLLRAFSSALIPFQGAMVGEVSGTTGFEPLDDLRSNLPQTAKLFGVLADAGNGFGDAARQRARVYQKAYGATPGSDDLNRAVQLLGLVAAGDRLAGHADSDLNVGKVESAAKWAILAQTVHGGSAHIDARYFNPDGTLMAPEQVAEQLGAGNWSLYDAQLSAALAGNQSATEAVRQAGRTFAAIATP